MDRSVSNDTYLTLRWLQQKEQQANISAKIIRTGGIESLEIGKVEYVYPFASRFGLIGVARGLGALKTAHIKRHINIGRMT